MFGQSGHFSDGILIIDNKKIAIELELNKKSLKRREKIFNHYQKQFDLKEVWYFCGNKEIKNQLDPYTKRAEFIKTYFLNEIL